MKSCFTNNNIIISVILIGLLICIFINYKTTTTEGFGPRWLRTRKNRMMRHMRRRFNPYFNNYFKKLERFRRKWL
jgi:hypothetical protein